MEKLKEFALKINIHDYYYPVMMIVYVLTLISFNIFRPGIVSAVFMVCIVALAFLKGLIPSFKKMSAPDMIMGIYIIYNILSVIWVTVHGYPVSVYLGELFTTALPMIFYFYGRGAGEKERDRFYTVFILSVLFIGIVGIILYITSPAVYLDYLFEHDFISKADTSTMRVRMQSLIGSTLLGYLGVASMLISMYFIEKEKGKAGKLIFVLSTVIAIMSNQRAAMAAAILIIVYLNVLVFFTYRLADRKYFIGELAVLIAVFAAFAIFFRGVILKIYYRLVSLPQAIGERSDQWVGAANNMTNIWLGNGLGVNGHRAIGINKYVIADGGLAKLYCEMGIIGTALFIFLVILILKRGVRDLKKYSAEAGLIVITLIMCTGSNMLSFALATPILYYTFGVIAGGRE
ncbi:MAG: hypothetical protein K6F99_09255 [Lachnospiraceae bacterium]|nr:hypothetical protein [Lachnospiraceae bacterium]